jgi:long-subunit acyl-CoA synthetase (AMP-forming)
MKPPQRKCITSDGWLLTGDVAQMDDDGFCRIISRKADMWYPEKAAKNPPSRAMWKK